MEAEWAWWINGRARRLDARSEYAWICGILLCIVECDQGLKIPIINQGVAANDWQRPKPCIAEKDGSWH